MAFKNYIKKEDWFNKAIHGDCLEVMKYIPDGSVDFILTDPPYGTTECAWDSTLPFDKMWEQLNRIIKPNGAIALFGSEPFSTKLRMSNIKYYKYDWYWVKNTITGFMHAHNKPLKNLELISIFSKGTTVHKSQSKNRMVYNPQGLIEINKTQKSGERKYGSIVGKRPSHKKEYVQKYTNFPRMVLEFKAVANNLHPTQKPVDLLEYLIRTYTNEYDLVLDFTMGVGSTLVACKNANRYFIGIEKVEKYYNTALERLTTSKDRVKSIKKQIKIDYSNYL